VLLDCGVEWAIASRKGLGANVFVHKEEVSRIRHRQNATGTVKQCSPGRLMPVMCRYDPDVLEMWGRMIHLILIAQLRRVNTGALKANLELLMPFCDWPSRREAALHLPKARAYRRSVVLLALITKDTWRSMALIGALRWWGIRCPRQVGKVFVF